MKLLIAEKPSVATSHYRLLLEHAENESFQRKDGYLEGKNWCISWCFGHMAGLSMPEAYGWQEWSLNNMPMIPEEWKFTINPESKIQFAVLKDLLGKADEVVNGTDAGREGELIYRWAVYVSGTKPKLQQRLWLSSNVLEDMVKAWQNRKPLNNYDNLYHSASSRAIGDWLVGINATRGYSIKTGIKGLSVGRVQTPTLALIVKRDQEVENWQTAYFYQLQAQWSSLPFLYYRENENQFENSQQLVPIQDQCNNKEASLTENKLTPKTTNPPKPFDLVTLQKEANKKLGLEAAKTLEAAQALYEARLITYPRTDSEYLPEAMQDEAYDLLVKISSVEQKKFLKSRNDSYVFFNSKKVSDHFAIIPTSHTQIPDSLNNLAQQVYNLITMRFIVAFGKPFLYNQQDLILSCDQYQFKSSIRVITDAGFKNLLSQEDIQNEESTQNDPELTLVAPVQIGDVAKLTNLEIVKKERTKPKYHTEDTLLTSMGNAGRIIENEEMKEAMKEKGLGTAATRSTIIETLKKRQYIETKKRNLISTAKGRALIKLVDQRISSPEMTGEWEYKLKQMEKGEFERKEFLAQIKNYLHELMPLFQERDDQFRQSMASPAIKCPCCAKDALRINKGGAFCGSCELKIWRKIGGKVLSDSTLMKLIEKGETTKLKGFTSQKTGKSFEAKLFLDKELKKVIFKF